MVLPSKSVSPPTPVSYAIGILCPLLCRFPDELLTNSKDRAVAERSVLIRNMLEDLGDEGIGNQAIPIPNVRQCHLKHVSRSLNAC